MAISFRRQQLVYGTTLALALVACVSSSMVNQYHDIDFDAQRLAQLNSVTAAAPPMLYSNAALALVSFALLISDLFRSNAIPVWSELLWTFLFGTLEIMNAVLIGMRYPTSHCINSPVDTQLKKRDSVDDSINGSYLNFQSSANREKIIEQAASRFCANWSVMFIFFAMIALFLFVQLGWLTLLGLRHRFSHPGFWTYATPAPYTWQLESSQPSRPADVESISSTSSVTKEKTLQLPVSAFLPQERQQ